MRSLSQASEFPVFQFVRRLLVALLLAVPLPLWSADLPQAVQDELRRAGIPTDAVAIWVQPVDAAAPTLQLNEHVAMNPASVMKLVTSFAALERLGPNYTWTTRVASSASLSGDTLAGDLVLVGGADPVLSYERLWKLLRQVRGLGIRRVAGDIILDGSMLSLPPHDPAAFDGAGDRPYNAGPGGIVLNFNALRLTFVTRPGAGAPILMSDPPLAGLQLGNHVRTVPGACGRWWYDELDMRSATAADGASMLEIGGRWRQDCGRRDREIAPLPASRFGPALVQALWSELGGSVGGSVREGTAPAEAKTLLEEDSPPLADVVRDMNKWSNNLIARQLLATLGASAGPAPDMVAQGAEVARAQLIAAGIDSDGLVIDNGAGLSRIARVSAATLGQLLRTVWQRPYMPEFIASLPIAGSDGTARRRLNGSGAAGQAHIKTGSVNGVSAIAGFVLDRNGRRHIVAMLVNHPKGGASRSAQDALLDWVWDAR
jgi:D-alanyl-D-alanine carboxypeptidase/D-alanyl-D-alanine-endopeptidase (penicillin-binding protein 4)